MLIPEEVTVVNLFLYPVPELAILTELIILFWEAQSNWCIPTPYPVRSIGESPSIESSYFLCKVTVVALLTQQ